MGPLRALRRPGREHLDRPGAAGLVGPAPGLTLGPTSQGDLALPGAYTPPDVPENLDLLGIRPPPPSAHWAPLPPGGDLDPALVEVGGESVALEAGHDGAQQRVAGGGV